MNFFWQGYEMTTDGIHTDNASWLSWLFTNYQAKIYRFIYWMVQDHETAHDLTQDTFLRAYSHANKLRESEHLSSWLYTTAKNICIDYWRKEKRHYTDDLTGSRPISHAADPNEIIEKEHISKLIRDVLLSLNAEQRKAVLLRDIDGYTYNEAAQLLGLTTPAYTSLLNRARAKFAQTLFSNLCSKTKKNLLGTKECMLLLKSFDIYNWPEDISYQVGERIRSYFDHSAKFYMESRETNYPAQLDEILLAKLRCKEVGASIDIGTGTGSIAEKLAKHCRRVYATDISPNMLSYAMKRFEAEGINNVELIQGDLCETITMHGKYDAAICSVVLHHLLEPAQAIKQMASSLRQFGTLVIADFSTHNYEWMLRTNCDIWSGFYTEQLAKWIKQAGLREVWAVKYDDICFTFTDPSGSRVSIPLVVAGGTKN